MIQFVLGWTVRSSILIAVGAALLWALRTRDASIKLVAWTAMLAGSLAIPLLGAALPPLPLVIAHKAPPPVLATDQPLHPTPVADADAGDGFQPIPSRPSFDWPRAAAILYAAASAVLLLRIVLGLTLSLRLLRRSRATGLPNVCESERVAAPVTLGILRPAVVLPLDWSDWDCATLNAVLAHERSHIERRDPAVQLLSTIHRALLWISPLSCLLHRWIVQAAEEASDDAAIAVTQDRTKYAEVLLGFIAKGLSPIGIGMARYAHPEKRIERILEGLSVPRGTTRWSAAAIAILACPLAYIAAATSMQKEQVIHFPALPAAPSAPEPVQIAQAQAPAPQAQAAPPPKPVTFDAVSIRPLGPGGGGRGGNKGGPQVCRPLLYTTGMVSGAATASRLIQDAYGLSPHQVSGGPEWLDDDRFCIEAKSPGPAEEEQLKVMLRTMLADRFRLVARHETKEMPVYVMTVARKGLLSEIRPGAPTTGGITVQDLTGYEFRTQVDQSVPPKMLVDRNTMQGFAAILSSFTLDVDRPVLDKTGLQGSYMFVMRWTDDDFRNDLEQQFGLKLEPGKAPLPAIAIESIQRPDAN